MYIYTFIRRENFCATLCAHRTKTRFDVSFEREGKKNLIFFFRQSRRFSIEKQTPETKFGGEEAHPFVLINPKRFLYVSETTSSWFFFPLVSYVSFASRRVFWRSMPPKTPPQRVHIYSTSRSR